MLSPNEFHPGSDSDRIEAAITAAIESGVRSIEIPRVNLRTSRPEWLIERAIVLPSDFTLLLNDCLVRLAPGTQDNIITNAGARTAPVSGNRNIRILGRGNAVLSGGLDAHFDPPGDRSGWRTIGILLYNTEHFTLDGFQMEETQAWAISLENGCAHGRISNIDFQNTNKYPNQDGIDIRKGCHDILIENITGITGDDTIALTGLLYKQPPGTRSMQVMSGPGGSDDIYNIIINNVKTTVAGGHHIVRVLNHDGIKIYNIFINGIMDTSRQGDVRNRAAVKIGDARYFSLSPAQLGDTSRIFVDNIVSRATHVVMIEGPLEDSTFRNIVGYGGNASLIHYGKAPIRNLKIEAHQFDASQNTPPSPSHPMNTPSHSVSFLAPASGNTDSGEIDVPLVFSIPASNQRQAGVLRHRRGSTQYSEDGKVFREIDSEAGFVVPSNYTAAQINQALRSHRILFFTPGATHLITEPVVIPSDSFIDFQGASLRLADGANCYLLKNENQRDGDRAIVLRNGRLIGNGSKQARNYNGDYRTGYFGFGTAFTKVEQLVMENFYVEETNAWGIAYFLCGTARFTDFRFNQAVGVGLNGDGITGIARRVFVKNVSGYTNDDMVAFSTGKGTLQGNDIGIADADNMDIEFVRIENVIGGAREGRRTHVGVGLYSTAGRTIRRVEVGGLQGEFDLYAYRIQNYWPGLGAGHFGKIAITGLDARVNRHYGAVIDVDDIEAVSLGNHTARESGIGASLITLANASVQSLSLSNCSATSANPGESSLVAIDPDKKSTIGRLSLEHCRVERPALLHDSDRL